MRVARPDGSTVHVAYCTNVHPATDLDGITRQLRTVAVPVSPKRTRDGNWAKARVVPDEEFLSRCASSIIMREMGVEGEVRCEMCVRAVSKEVRTGRS